MSDEERRGLRTDIIVLGIVLLALIGVLVARRFRGPEGYNRRGEAELRAMKLVEAEKDFRAAVQQRPDFAGAWNNLSIVLSYTGRFDEALSCCDRAIMLNPVWADAHRNRGNIHEVLQRYDQAISDYNTAIALKPDLAAAYAGRAGVFCQLKRYSEAQRNANECLRLGGSLPPDFLNKLRAQAAAEGAASNVQRPTSK